MRFTRCNVGLKGGKNALMIYQQDGISFIDASLRSPNGFFNVATTIIR